MSVIFAQAARQWQSMRTDYERYIESAYNAALESTGGVLVNNAGRALHVDGYTLFTGSSARAYRFASWELLEFWERSPRLSLAEFEARWASGELEALR